MTADELLDAYTSAFITAQMVRTPEAWLAAGAAWDGYFDLLMTSEPDQYRERKEALATLAAYQERHSQ